ncbi:MAG TPA: SusC/RagA family TonB-linked outer membrane protein [Bacteroidales bacterium]|nr:SusC/RagA family TonB-linked outer membrane protein [Bacteroidales bacterium]
MKKPHKLNPQGDFFSSKGRPLQRICKIGILSLLSLILGYTPVKAEENGLKTSTTVSQQTFSISGKVTDKSGTPVPGVTVTLKGTTTGAMTDADGKYTITGVSNGSIIVFSFMGLKSQEVTVSGSSNLNIEMEEDSIALQEVVVVGYGSMTKKEISSSIVSVNKEDFQKGAVSDPMELLVGKVAGLNIDNSSASPHSSSSFQIRGATSITGGNTPLVVIDGIAGGNLNTVATQDIESIVILKDAASAAIYGTRGANGVIIITTKMGADGGKGAFDVTYNSYFSNNLMHKLPESLGHDEFVERARGIDYGYNDDWLGQLKRKFSYDNNQYLSVSGSTEKSRYNISFNYVNNTGLDKANESTRYGVRISHLQKTLKDLVEIGTTINLRATDALTGPSGITNTVFMNPTQPIWNDDGTYNHPTTSTNATNPVEEANIVTDENNTVFATGTIEAKIQLINSGAHSLSTSANNTIDYNNNKNQYYYPSTGATSSWNGYKGRATLGNTRNWTNQFEWTTNYTYKTSTHLLRGVAGYSFTENFSDNMSMTNYNFDFDQFLYNDIGSGTYLAAGRATMASGKNSSRLVGVFGRVNYSWKELLTATASLRYEGSSRFGVNNKWGYFPAVSASWEITKMPFMAATKDIINGLKLRASYGVTGRQAGSDYASLQTYNSKSTYYYMDGAWVAAYGPSKNANPNLAWELGISSDIGIDFEIYRRFRGSIEYFDRRSEDLLSSYSAPQPPFIFNSILVNLGSTKNTGMEVSLDGDIIKKSDFSWGMNLTYSYGTTILTKLSNDVYKASYIDLMQRGGLGTSEYYFRLVEGGKIGEVYGYKHAGVDENGELLVLSKEGEAIPKTAADNSDKQYIGNTAPKHFFSLTNSVRYKNWDLSIFTRGAAGMKMWNGQLMNNGLKGSAAQNVLRTAYTKYDYITSDGSILSSFYLENGAWFKIEKISFGYTVPFRNTNLVKSMYWYISADNLATFTGFTGIDPSTATSIGLTPGITGSTALVTTQLTLGTTIKF